MNTIDHEPWQRHENNETRRQAVLASKRKWAHKKWNCETCCRTINISNKVYHLKSKIHKQNLN